MDTEVRKLPLGVCARLAVALKTSVVCPKNWSALHHSTSLRMFPICLLYSPVHLCRMIPLWSIPMATVTGNTLILKPSERDPGAAMILAELCEHAGL